MMYSRVTIAAIAVLIASTAFTYAIAGGAEAQTGAVGVFLKSSDTDVTKLLTATWPTSGIPHLVCRDTDGTAGCTIGDDYFIHFDTALAAGNLRVNDIKIAGPSTTSRGTWLTSTSAEVGLAYTMVGRLDDGSTPFRCIELDGLNGWTKGDGLYLDVGTQFGNTVGNGVMDRGDIRLLTRSTPVSITAGTIIDSLTDADLTATNDASKLPTSATYGCVAGETATTFVPLWYDATGNGAVDNTDTVLVSPVNSATGGVTQTVAEIGDVLISPSTIGGGSFGTQLTTLPTGTKNAMRQVTPLLAITEAQGVEAIHENRLYIHFADQDGTNDDILENDVQVAGKSRTAGTRVTSVSAGQGEVIGCAGITGCTAPTSALAGNLYYIEADGIVGLTSNDPIFLNRPATMGGGGGACEPCVSIGDVRVTRATAGNYPAGSVVKAGDTDLSAYSGITGVTGFAVKAFDTDMHSAIPLRSLTQAKIGRLLAGFGAPPTPPFPAGCTGAGPFPTSTTDVCSFFDTVNDIVYDTCTGSTVISGCVRLYVGTAAAGLGVPAAGTTVACPADADCPGNAADVGALRTENRIKVTGTDTTNTPGFSEFVVFSTDNFVGPGDGRITGTFGGGAAGSYIAVGDAEGTGSPLSASGEKLLASLDAGCPATCWPFPQVNDVFLGSWGQQLTGTSSEVARRLTTLTPTGLAHYSRGVAGDLTDDTFYAIFSAGALPPTAIQQNDVRLTPGPGGSAGTFLESNTASQEELSASGKTFDGANDLTSRIMWMELDSFAGPTAGDWLYLDSAGSVVAGTLGALDLGDIRLVKVTAGGSTLSAGTIVKTNDADRSAGLTPVSPTGAAAFVFYYFDANGNGRLDKGDTVYLHYAPTGTPDVNLPHLNDVRLTGTGGQTSTTSPSGGGGTTPPPPAPTSAPASISILQPSDGYLQTGVANTISGSASAGTTSGVANSITSVTVTIGGVAQTVTGTSSWSITYTPASDGAVTVTATVTPSSGAAVSTTRTFTANADGVPPATTKTCPDGSTVATSADCPVVDEQAREDAQEAKDAARDAKDAAERAEQTAGQAKHAAEGAKQAAENNSALANQVLQQLLSGNTTDEDGVPGPGPALAILAILAAVFVARRRR